MPSTEIFPAISIETKVMINNEHERNINIFEMITSFCSVLDNSFGIFQEPNALQTMQYGPPIDANKVKRTINRVRTLPTKRRTYIHYIG